jgi:opacity protein-like surface antigen
MKRIALLFLAFLLLAVPALAASPSNYATLKLGAYLPQDDDLDEFDTGFNGEVAFGHYFNPNVALEFGVGYLKTEGEVPGVSGEITSHPILLSIKGVTQITGGEFYGMAGVGFYITDAEVSTLGVTVNSDDTPFGFHFGVGGNLNLSPNAFLGLEAKYFWAKPSFDVLGITSFDFHLDGIQATANIGYRF